VTSGDTFNVDINVNAGNAQSGLGRMVADEFMNEMRTRFGFRK